jgi:formylglycine-generating enzyme required for sulfatase activity
VDGDQIVGFYPGDVFRGVKHEVEISPGDYIIVPLNDPASRFGFDGSTFSTQPGYENHPMTNVSWFGAWGYCGYIPASEVEWKKAARSTTDEDRSLGDEIARNINFTPPRSLKR